MYEELGENERADRIEPDDERETLDEPDELELSLSSDPPQDPDESDPPRAARASASVSRSGGAGRGTMNADVTVRGVERVIVGRSTRGAGIDLGIDTSVGTNVGSWPVRGVGSKGRSGRVPNVGGALRGVNVRSSRGAITTGGRAASAASASARARIGQYGSLASKRSVVVTDARSSTATPTVAGPGAARVAVTGTQTQPCTTS